MVVHYEDLLPRGRWKVPSITRLVSNTGFTGTGLFPEWKEDSVISKIMQRYTEAVITIPKRYLYPAGEVLDGGILLLMACVCSKLRLCMATDVGDNECENKPPDLEPRFHVFSAPTC
jgi:hypothetical protein